VKRALRRLRSGDDAGFSLIDMMVTLSVISILTVVSMSAISEIYSNVTRTENTSFAREQVGNSFRRLDKELRYATWIADKAGQVGTAWYLEYSVPPPAATPTEVCRQLKFDKGVLTLLRWDPAAGGPGKPTTIGTDLTLNATAPPFMVIPPSSAVYNTKANADAAGVGTDFEPDYFQVRVQFNATLGRVSLPLDLYFTAQNTSGSSSSTSDCSNGRP
jgi:type II secretory pathway pseudopilin PulG